MLFSRFYRWKDQNLTMFTIGRFTEKIRMIALLMEEILNFLNFGKEEEKNIKKYRSFQNSKLKLKKVHFWVKKWH